MTEEKITIQIQIGDHNINLAPDQAREIFHGLLTIFRGGGDYYWWPEGKITTSGGSAEGSWRRDLDGNDLKFQRRESGNWITKHTIEEGGHRAWGGGEAVYPAPALADRLANIAECESARSGLAEILIPRFREEIRRAVEEE